MTAQWRDDDKYVSIHTFRVLEPALPLCSFPTGFGEWGFVMVWQERTAPDSKALRYHGTPYIEHRSMALWVLALPWGL